MHADWPLRWARRKTVEAVTGMRVWRCRRAGGERRGAKPTRAGGAPGKMARPKWTRHAHLDACTDTRSAKMQNTRPNCGHCSAARPRPAVGQNSQCASNINAPKLT